MTGEAIAQVLDALAHHGIVIQQGRRGQAVRRGQGVPRVLGMV